MILEIHKIVKDMQKALEKAGRTDVSKPLAYACLNLRVAHERWIGEGKTGDQTSSRSYAGPSDSKGLVIPKTPAQENLLDEENSRAAQRQRTRQQQTKPTTPVWDDPMDNMPF